MRITNVILGLDIINDENVIHAIQADQDDPITNEYIQVIKDMNGVVDMQETLIVNDLTEIYFWCNEIKTLYRINTFMEYDVISDEISCIEYDHSYFRVSITIVNGVTTWQEKLNKFFIDSNKNCKWRKAFI